MFKYSPTMYVCTYVVCLHFIDHVVWVYANCFNDHFRTNEIIWKFRVVLPNIGAAVSQPLSADVILKSHVAAGNTKDTIVIPMAVFA